APNQGDGSPPGPAPVPAREAPRLSERMPPRSPIPTAPKQDALGRLKASAVEALFERLGARLSDPDMDEAALQKLVLAELNAVVEESKVRLTAPERLRLIREVQDDVLGL